MACGGMGLKDPAHRLIYTAMHNCYWVLVIGWEMVHKLAVGFPEYDIATS